MAVTPAPWVAFPPGGRLQVRVDAGRTASAAVTMSSACRIVPVALMHVAWGATRLAGGRVLPGRRHDLALDTLRSAVLARAAAAGGAQCRPAAVLERRQSDRGGLLALLARDGVPWGFVKAAPTAVAEGIVRECACLDRFEARQPELYGRPLLVPRLLAAGELEDWTWVVHSVLPDRPHRPAGSEDAAHVAAIVAATIGDLASASVATSPPDWKTIHGDFAPWNLRRVGRRDVALFDFEDATTAPPAADATYFELTHSVLHDRPPAPGLDRAALEYWRARVSDRLSAGTDPAMNGALLGAIGAAQ